MEENYVNSNRFRTSKKPVTATTGAGVRQNGGGKKSVTTGVSNTPVSSNERVTGTNGLSEEVKVAYVTKQEKSFSCNI